MYFLGFDIGGTKCAVVTAECKEEHISFCERRELPTDLTVSAYEMISRLIRLADEILTKKPDAIGISCGGPLNEEQGVILSPPNLPSWDNIEIVRILEEHYGTRAYLENDANACALAEWKYGAGRGCNNMIFMTFGTGLGAGLILDGRLYRGANGNAGEVGHIRLKGDGPVGFGKAGSFEGFCSGGGIRQLAIAMAKEAESQGQTPSYYQSGESGTTARTVAEAARNGDAVAVEVYRRSGAALGMGLSFLIDVLNPERIVIGSVFARANDLLTSSMNEVLEHEALAPSLSACRVVSAELGERIGDYAAIAIAMIRSQQ